MDTQWMHPGVDYTQDKVTPTQMLEQLGIQPNQSAEQIGLEALTALREIISMVTFEGYDDIAYIMHTIDLRKFKNPDAYSELEQYVVRLGFNDLRGFICHVIQVTFGN